LGRITLCQTDESSESEARPPGEFDLVGSFNETGHTARTGRRRVLFLDDDPVRAIAFLAENPDAVWVKTAAECLERLSASWEEVHLDHDLGGRIMVDTSDDDCGMEVIRWLSLEPRTHLHETQFFVHTHNFAAGLLMVLTMREGGYKAEFRPFGHRLERLLARNDPGDPKCAESSETEPAHVVPPPAHGRRWLKWLAALLQFRSGTPRETGQNPK
jgi:hypothetical protein